MSEHTLAAMAHSKCAQCMDVQLDGAFSEVHWYLIMLICRDAPADSTIEELMWKATVTSYKTTCPSLSAISSRVPSASIITSYHLTSTRWRHLTMPISYLAQSSWTIPRTRPSSRDPHPTPKIHSIGPCHGSVSHL
jgi:hypothetical protein